MYLCHCNHDYIYLFNFNLLYTITIFVKTWLMVVLSFAFNREQLVTHHAKACKKPSSMTGDVVQQASTPSWEQHAASVQGICAMESLMLELLTTLS